MRYQNAATAMVLLAAGAWAFAQPSKSNRQEKTMHEATGTFDVKMLPPAAGEAPSPAGFVRLSLDKSFQGGLEGTSRVEMMASSDGRDPSGGYVALERFTGKLDGRSGSFILQHSGVMAPGLMEIHVLVTPGSGTGQLAGIAGSLVIRKDGKQHFYTLRYTLPPA